ncbi:MAG: hypothetical protein LBQ50_08425 [Planctomycetaceae bacterium]|jgi:DNA-directed RNA polymerase subunit M/transcription elongation factor TFIIS|nr:hypothetical protein [Planctomycetaceae bacterium]
MVLVRFRCIRCQHPIEVLQEMVGKKMYCPVCYLELTVPAESTIKPVDESRLYTADETPIDVREMGDRKRLMSLRCPVCHTYITVSKEQIGTNVVCPECERAVRVPESIGDKAERVLSDRQMMFGDPGTYTLRNGDIPVADHRSTNPAIRVYCRLCGTMMYASEDQIGSELTCPDCETKTLVPFRSKPVPLPPPLPSSFEGGTTFALADGSSKSMLVPVVCVLCGTRMYAGENEIGGFKTCPDCGRKTEIKAVTKSEMIQPVVSPNGGYGVSQSEIPEKTPTFRTLTDYRYVEGSLDKELYDKKKSNAPKSVQPPPFPVLYNPESSPDSENRQTAAQNANLHSPTLRQHPAAKQTALNTDHVLIKMVKRTALPKYPFLSRIFVPFLNARLWGQTVIASLLGIVGLVGGAMLPTMLSLDPLFVTVSAPFGVILIMLGLSLLANTCFSLFLWTTTGNDLPEKDDWQEYRLLESGSLTVWLFLLALLAVTPGYLLQSHTAALPEQISDWSIQNALLHLSFLTGSLLLFFPVLFLSSMESGSYFVVIAKETCRSLIDCTGVWLRFYLISLLLSALFCFIVGLVSIATNQVLVGFAVLIPVVSVFSIFYARFLGRLGWALEELARPDEEE